MSKLQVKVILLLETFDLRKMNLYMVFSLCNFYLEFKQCKFNVESPSVIFMWYFASVTAFRKKACNLCVELTNVIIIFFNLANVSSTWNFGLCKSALLDIVSVISMWNFLV